MGAPQNFTITTTNSSLNLTWSRPVIYFQQFAGIIIAYTAFCSDDFTEKHSFGFDTSIVITAGIEPGRHYSCFVRAVTHLSSTTTNTSSVVTEDIGKLKYRNTVLDLLFLTLVPGPPTEFTGVSNTSTSITFTFKPPQKPNGVISNYLLQCYTAMIENKIMHALSLNVAQDTGTLTELQPYTNYSCNITAHNIHGEGRAATTSVVTMQDGK